MNPLNFKCVHNKKSFKGKFGLMPKGPTIVPLLLGEGIRGVVEKCGTLDEANGMLQAGIESCRPWNSAWMKSWVPNLQFFQPIPICQDFGSFVSVTICLELAICVFLDFQYILEGAVGSSSQLKPKLSQIIIHEFCMLFPVKSTK
jgi:hypothetical protein